MADYYTLFSTEIKNLTPEEKSWSKGKLDQIAHNFNYELDENLWIYANVYGDVGEAADFIQEFLQEFRKRDCNTLSWASTCSKPRINEQGGGAAFITAKKIRYMDTYVWLSEQEKKWKRKK